MILANIKDADRYCSINPCCSAVFEFLKTLTTESKEGFVGDNYKVNFSGSYQKVVLRKGDFCIVFPEDAHIPMMVGDTGDRLMKAVAKVKL